MNSEGAKGGEQVLLGPVEERPLVLAADLNQREVGEPRIGEGLGRRHHRVHVVTARDGLRDVLGTDELGRGGERRGPGSSALTFQPPENQRNCSCARATAALWSRS